MPLSGSLLPRSSPRARLSSRSCPTLLLRTRSPSCPRASSRAWVPGRHTSMSAQVLDRARRPTRPAHAPAHQPAPHLTCCGAYTARCAAAIALCPSPQHLRSLPHLDQPSPSFTRARYSTPTLSRFRTHPPTWLQSTPPRRRRSARPSRPRAAASWRRLSVAARSPQSARDNRLTNPPVLPRTLRLRAHRSRPCAVAGLIRRPRPDAPVPPSAPPRPL